MVGNEQEVTGTGAISGAESEITVIRPNVAREEAIALVDPAEPFDLPEVKLVGYPVFLFEYEVVLERIIISDKRITLSTTVDAMLGNGYRIDAYPELETHVLPASSVFEPKTDHEEAVEESRSVVRRYITREYATFVLIGKMPDITITRDDLAFNLYWLVPDRWDAAGETVGSIVNAVSGEVINEDVKLAALSERQLGW